MCVDCRGPLDRVLFTHPDRQRAAKNCTIFPLKSPLILRRSVFTAASLFCSFPLRVCVRACVCIHCIWVCVCILVPSLHPENETQKVGANCLRRRETETRRSFLVPQTPPPPPPPPPPPTPRLLLSRLVAIICLCKKPQYDSQSNQLAAFPKNCYFWHFGAYLIENLILATRWPLAACETCVRPPLHPIRGQSSMMTALRRQGGREGRQPRLQLIID